ncbi:MAG TPA: transcription termination/antitermination NusG family protein [Haloferula sp.]
MSPPPPSEAAWYCLKTQTKREAIAAAHLRELEGVEVFCPLLRYRKATRRGKVWWVEALFPGYLLARFHLRTDERAVMYSQGVRGLVRFGEKVPEVPDDFVELLRQEVAKQGEKEVLTVVPRIAEGEEVELAHGPLGGVKATVVEVLPARERVRVLLEFLGREQVVEVDLFSLLLPRKPLP